MAKDLTAAWAEMSENAAGTTRQDKTLKPRPNPDPIPSRTGRPKPKLPSGGTGDGVASPLVETAYAAREWHPDATLLSTDGLIALRVKRIKTIVMADANSREVVFEYKAE